MNTFPKILVGFFLLSVAALEADPIGVSYTVSGSSGDYTLDFTVTNNISGAADQDVYFFGVKLSARDITGSPDASWDPDAWPIWDNSAYGGSSITYNNNWSDLIGFSLGHLNFFPGSSLSGFNVHISDPVAPTSVNWFAYALGNDPYTGGENFNPEHNGAVNPGFEGVSGVTSTSPVPEPSAVMLVGTALLGVVGTLRRTRPMETSRFT